MIGTQENFRHQPDDYDPELCEVGYDGVLNYGSQVDPEIMLAWKMHKKMRLFRSTFDELYGDGPESDIDQDIYSDNFSDKEEEIQELENNRRAGNHRSRNEGILTSGARLGYVTTAGSKEGRGRPIHRQQQISGPIKS